MSEGTGKTNCPVEDQTRYCSIGVGEGNDFPLASDSMDDSYASKAAHKPITSSLTVVNLPTATSLKLSSAAQYYIYYNSNVFIEIALSLKQALQAHGILAKAIDFLDTKYFSDQALFIILGLNNPIGKLPPKYIAYQLEQTGNQISWFSQSYLEKLRGALEIWDYSIRNIQNLKLYQLPCPVKYVPIGYSPNLERIQYLGNLDPNPSYDVLFFGSANPRRDQLMEQLKTAGLKVFYAQYSLWAEERDRLITASKIVLNIHYYENPTLETSRLSYLLANKAFVISEPSLDPILDKAYSQMVVFAPYDQILTTCQHYLQPEQTIDRLQQAEQGYQLFKTNHPYHQGLPLKVFETFLDQTSNLPIVPNESTRSPNSRSPAIKPTGQSKPHSKFRQASNDIFQPTTGFYEILDEHTCPTVSIITPTARRSWAISIAVRNFLHTFYPADKLEWIILDTEPTEQICLPEDSRITYLEVDPAIPLWQKRNFGVEKATGEVIVHMDDDDYYFPQHVWVKVNLLAKYKQQQIQCVGNTELGIYHLLDHYSYLNTTQYVSEASMAYTKEFWRQRPFSAKHPEMGEGYFFLQGREKQVMTFPYHHNFIAITHHENFTGRLRTYRDNQSQSRHQNLFNLWDTETQVFFLELKNKIKKLKITENN